MIEYILIALFIFAVLGIAGIGFWILLMAGRDDYPDYPNFEQPPRRDE